jgi:hypothetical protein
MKPRKKFRTRPKKKGAKKRQRIKSQKKRLVAAGVDEDVVFHMTDAQIRKKLQEVSRKKAPKRQKAVKKAAKKTVKKATRKKTKKTAKKSSKKTA